MMQATPITYLALGDSYTIGEAVLQEESFPYQLQNAFKQQAKEIESPKIIATTGWTTDELIKAIDEAEIQQHFDVVTLLIGVNNQYRDYDLAVYKVEFKALLETALSFANGRADRVFVLSIPDWGVTPFAESHAKSKETIGAEIDLYNEACKEITISYGIDYTDITIGSRRAASEPDLIANDGLHPGASMYKEWVNQLFPKILRALA